ncbi:MAG: hypothetical protein ACP5XB_04895 [Isosphaeraceae bacterium]
MMKRWMMMTVAACLSTLSASAQQTDNYELRAVPAPGRVVVDGRLSDWDLSGEIVCCYDLAVLKKTNSVRAAVMYDANCLYFSFRFKDKTPLVNRIRPVAEANDAWKSDAVQLRIKSDRAAHVNCWYYTDKHKPAMSIHYGMWNKESDRDFAELPDAIAAGAQEAFVKDADGQGYVQEIALPWKLITRDGPALKSGDEARMGLEFFWGDASGRNWPAHRFADLVNQQQPQRAFFWENVQAWGTLRLLDHGKLEPSLSLQRLSLVAKQQELLYKTEGPAPIRYTMPFDGAATLVIEKPDGTRVKNLIGDYPRAAGEHTDYWDGTDDDGHPVAAGQYRVRGLCHEEFDVKWEFAYGNPGNPPYDNSKGTGGWLSNHMPPMDVAAGKDRVYISAPFSEGATAVMAADLTGQRKWGIGGIAGGMMAEDGQYLYVLSGGTGESYGQLPADKVAILRINAATGSYAPWGDGKFEHVIGSVPPSTDWRKLRRPEGEVVENHGFGPEWCQRQTMGLALAGGKLYGSLYYENKIIAVDPQEGKATGEILVQKPAGLAGAVDGTLYAISGKQVVKIDGQGKATPVVAANLSAPVGLAMDGKGNLYVSDWGEAMCVKVFSPDGKLLRTVGKKGGRSLVGVYEPDGMFLPWGIAVDSQNRLWAAECDTSPRRVSVWNTESRQFLQEFCGTTWYAAIAAQVNQLNPDQAFVLGNICQLDWKQGLWRVTGTLHRPTSAQDLFSLSMEGQKIDVRKVGKRTLLLSGNSDALIITELGADSAKPLAAMGTIYLLAKTTTGWPNQTAWPDVVLRHLTDTPEQLEDLKKRYPGALDGRGIWYPDTSGMLGDPLAHSQFLWVDQNGDGLVQDNEIQLFTLPQLKGMRLDGWMGPGWRYAIGADLAVYRGGSDNDGGYHQQLWKLPVKQWNDCGAPVYEIQDAKRIAREACLGGVDSSIWTDARGQTLIGQNPLMMFSPEGKLLWTYPNQWPGVHGSFTAPLPKRGLLIGPLYVLGSAQVPEVGEVFCMNSNMGRDFFFTTDGLYIGNLFQDCRGAPEILPDEPRRGMSVKACSAGGEPFGGEFFQNPRDGKYYVGGSLDSCREASVIAQMTGLETVRRFPTQDLTYSEAQHAECQEFLAKQAVKQAAAKVLAITRVKGRAKLDADGILDWSVFKFSDIASARWAFSPGRSVGNATWTFDDNNLYLGLQGVQDQTPMINGGRDVRTLFKTGDAVEFELRTAADNDAQEVIPGDLRLVVSVFEDKPVAVLYRYKVPGTTEPVPFTSPVGTTNIDQVEVLKDARIAIDRHGDFYQLRAAIPLKDLGFAPTTGKTYRGDFGIVHSNKAGTINELRMYWANPITGMVSDLFSESQINPPTWGRFRIDAVREGQ